MKGGKKEVNMNKNKILLTIFLLGVLVFGVSGVSADENQNTTTNVTKVMTFQISPLLLDFGPLAPGQTSNREVTANATGSNVNLSVTVDVANYPFHDWLLFEGYLADNYDFNMSCIIDGNICTYDIEEISANLTIPQGTLPGVWNGVITYTIEEAI